MAKISKHGPSWLICEDGEWKEIPESVAIVKRIFELACNGWGPDDIETILTPRGQMEGRRFIPAPPPTRTIGSRSTAVMKWGAGNIDKLLKNHAVYGMMDQGNGNLLGVYPEIVSYDDFMLVEELRGLRAGGPKKSISNIFSGLLFCGACKAALKFRVAKDRDHVSLVECLNGCMRQIDYLEFELWVLMSMNRKNLMTLKPVGGLVTESDRNRAIARLYVNLRKDPNNKELRLRVYTGILRLIEKIDVLSNEVAISFRDKTVGAVEFGAGLIRAPKESRRVRKSS